MKCLFQAFCCFIFLSLSYTLRAQELNKRIYTTLDGLTDNSLTCFYQDKLGYLWIGTTRGLDRFDGTNFKNFGIQNGLPSVMCNQIMEDQTGRIWVATRNGMAEFRKDSFYVYEIAGNKKINYVYQIYEDAGGQLIANTAQGQYRFEGKQWHPYASVRIMNKERIGHTLVAEEGEYYFTQSEIFFKNKSNRTVSVWRLQNDYFGSPQYAGGKVYVKTTTGVFVVDSVRKEKLFENELANRTVANYFIDSFGRLWLSTSEDGVLMLQQKDGYITQQTFTVDYKEISIAGFFEDLDNQMWVSTARGPMKILRPSFSSVEIGEVKPGQHIRNMIPIGDHSLMLSISDGQIIIIQCATEGPASYEILANYAFDEPNDFVDNYAFGPKGEMWMATRNRQLYLLQNNTLLNKTNLFLPGQVFAREMVSHPHTGQMIVALDSILTIGDSHTLDTFFDSDHQFIKFPRQIDVLKDDQIVIRTLDGEIYLYDAREGHKHHFNKITTPAKHYKIIDVDHAKQLWVYNVGESIAQYQATPSGIRLNDEINQLDDNVSTQFYHFLIDREGGWWCVNNKGIQHIYKDNQERWLSEYFIVYEISQNALPDWFTIAEYKEKIWVNLRNQLIYFDRKTPASGMKSKSVVVEDVQLHNQTTSWENYSDSLHSYFQIPDHPQLTYNQNTLTFYYNSPTAQEYQRTSYSYRLLPMDTAWSKASTNRSISFYQLKPAQYTFQVRSRNMGMDWGEVTLFPFTIQKPFWDTTWFRIITLAFAAGLITWAFRIRLRQERAKGEIKNQLLELEMRALRAQMNPHFIFNALNSIQSLVATNQTSAANKYISKFARLLRQVLENSRRSEITLKQELESLRLYVDLEQLRLDSQIAFIETIDDEIDPATVLIPPLIIQPFIENALWHGLSSKDGEKRISLSIALDRDWVEITIEDNGIGRQAAAAQKSNSDQHESTALEVTGQRILDFNFPLKNNPIQIEDITSETGQALGTRVLLHVTKKPVFSPAAQ